MKKFLSVLLTVLLLSCFMVTSVFAAITVDSNSISCVDFLDFSNDRNTWTKYNEETGVWENILTTNPLDEEGNVIGAYLSKENAFADHLDWSLQEDGEILHMVAKDTSTSAGMQFVIDSSATEIKIGAEDSKQTEYVKIRIRNSSSSTKIGFGWTVNWTSSITRSIAILDIDSNMTGWTTYIFSARQLNYDTNYQGLTTSETTWGGALKSFIVFPFGYGKHSNTYEGATMDIDYIVIGSYDYVTNYKSELEKKEDSVVSFEPVTLPEKTTYYIGDYLDLTGFTAKVTYDDGTSEITSNCNASYNFENEGDSKVTLFYGKESFSYNVKVVGVSDVKVETMPESEKFQKTDVMINGFNPTGLTLRVNYKDGTSQIKEIGSFRFIDATFNAAGDYIVTINFYGSTTTFPVTIIDIEKLIFTPKYEKLYYGSEITVDSFEIKCVYNDGSEQTIQEANLVSFLQLNYDTKIAGGETTISANLVNSNYDISINQSFPITVETPTALKVDRAGVSTYNTDAMLNTTALEVSYVYADGTKARIDVSDPSLKMRYDFSTPGEKTVKVIAGSLSDTFTVKVREPSFGTPSIVRDGKITLLKAKFPTGALVAIILAAIIVVFGGILCYLKFVKKVSFKRTRKRARFDDIF